MERINTIEMTREEAEVIVDFINFLSQEDIQGYDVSEVLNDIDKAFLKEEPEVITVNGIRILIK